MYASSLIKYLSEDKYSKNVFCGVKSINEINNLKLKKPCSLIVNTHKSNQPGEHWFAIYLPLGKPIEIFDSFGLMPNYNELKSFVNINGKSFIYNKKHLQHYSNNTCGLFCLLYILFRSRNFSYIKIMKFFVHNKFINDKIVINIFKKLNKKINK